MLVKTRQHGFGVVMLLTVAALAAPIIIGAILWVREWRTPPDDERRLVTP